MESRKPDRNAVGYLNKEPNNRRLRLVDLVAISSNSICDPNRYRVAIFNTVEDAPNAAVHSDANTNTVADAYPRRLKVQHDYHVVHIHADTVCQEQQPYVLSAARDDEPFCVNVEDSKPVDNRPVELGDEDSFQVPDTHSSWQCLDQHGPHRDEVLLRLRFVSEIHVADTVPNMVHLQL